MTEQVRIDLTAKDDASKVIDKVADAAEDLEKLEPEIEITADGADAKAGIDSVAEAAEALSRADAEIVLRAKIDAAKGDLKALRDDLDQTSDAARRTDEQLDKVGGGGGEGLKTRGNAIADLTGPLGEASGAASDFAGVFDGLGDIVEDAANKMGASASQAAAISGAVGGIGIAVAGAAALWSMYTSRQEAARKKQEELIKGQRELNKALKEGDTSGAGQKIVDLYEDAFNAADKFGIKTGEVTRFLLGESDAIPSLTAAIQRNREVMEGHTDATDAQRVAAFTTAEQLRVLTDTLNGQKAANEGATTAIVEQDARLKVVNDTLEQTGLVTHEASGKWRVFRGATIGAGDAAKDTADDLDAASRAQQRLRDENDRTSASIDRIRDALSLEGELLTFRDRIGGILKGIQDGVSPTESELNDLKLQIVDLAKTAGANPVDIKTTLRKVDQGDLWGVAGDVERYYQNAPVKVATVLKAPQVRTSGSSPTIVPAPGMAPPSDGGVPMITVNQYVPRGYRGDVLADARAAARRTGGLYRRSRR